MSNIPQKCSVLIVGGGPGGSFTAAALAREGINTVLLEAAKFPRYHVGESMLPSLRHFMRFIDLDDRFATHGFHQKNGAAFKLNQTKDEGYTDFISTGGPDNYTWNVVRSESDEILFRHAGRSGAKIFDEIRVTSINFASSAIPETSEVPVSANYKSIVDGTSGQITFDYVVDASGRAGILHTKYLKDRTYNTALKNIASWGYWKNTSSYGIGTERANSPFFEALADESGWAWFIPLHNGTTSVGIVVNHEAAASYRQGNGTDDTTQPLSEFYLSVLRLAPQSFDLLKGGYLASDIKSASDYSYSSSVYAIPHARTVGDAGCFIDPFFSSGVHLALTGGLSAAVTICAALRGDCSEQTACDWHSQKIRSAYSRFLVVVLSAYRQMRKQDEHILSQIHEDNFDQAFLHLRPIIQGIVDVDYGSSKDALARTLDFLAAAFNSTQPEEKDAVLKTLLSDCEITSRQRLNDSAVTNENSRSIEEDQVINHIQARRAMDTKSTFQLDTFDTDVINGLTVNLQRGDLGLVGVS